LTPVLVDTGVLVALFDRSERHHEACAAAIQEIDVPILTCEAVLAESFYLLRSFKSARDALLENVENGTFLTPYRVASKIKTLRRLLKKYANVPMDFADACLVDMADEYQTDRIFTLDGDFHIYRWGKNRPFRFGLDRL
jgi:predicted nucleic acid-binding protein